MTVQQSTVSAVGDIGLMAESWRRSLLAENKADSTVKTYAEAVRLFDRFVRGQGMPTEVTNLRREHVESFIAHLLKNWKPATASNRYRALRVFFGWLLEEGEIQRSPMDTYLRFEDQGKLCH